MLLALGLISLVYHPNMTLDSTRDTIMCSYLEVAIEFPHIHHTVWAMPTRHLNLVSTGDTGLLAHLVLTEEGVWGWLPSPPGGMHFPTLTSCVAHSTAHTYSAH